MKTEVKKGLVWTNRFGRQMRVYRVSQSGGWAHVGANHIHAEVSKWTMADVLASLKEAQTPIPSVESNLRAILALCDNPHFTSDRKYRIAELANEAIALLSK